MDIPDFAIDRDKRDLTAYYGQYMSETHINQTYELFFSCDPDDYYKILQKYSFCDRHRDAIIRNVREFINSCLILGGFLHDVSGLPLNIFTFYCITEFTLFGIVDRYSDKEIQHRFLNLLVTIRVNTNGMVAINIWGHHDRNSNCTEICLVCPHNIIIYCPPTLDIRRTKDTDKYAIMNRVFNPPPYRKLPLYINDLFVKDYARMMLENPPPPPPQYIQPKNYFPYF
jgi:hypothetical protein